MRLVTENTRIRSVRGVSTPAQVQAELPLSETAAKTTFETRREIHVKVAVDACQAARVPHRFLSLTQQGQISIFETAGNEDCHVILRGGSSGINFDAASVEAACAALAKAGLRPQVMIDFAHANSSKQHRRQIVVGQEVGRQIAAGDRRIIGAMIESHLVEGRQDIGSREKMTYGQSVTDPCIGWDDTVKVLHVLSDSVAQRRDRPARSA